MTLLAQQRGLLMGAIGGHRGAPFLPVQSHARRGSDLRLIRPVILLRGLPATAGSLRRFQADSRAGSARDEKKPAVVM
jgi:hypothetical protein